MKNGRIGLVEDHELFRILLKEGLTLAGHEIVLEEETVASAIEALDRRFDKYGSVALDAVLLDGNLSGGDDNSDGVKVARHLRTIAGPNLLIASISSTQKRIDGDDVRLPKDEHFILKFLEGYEPPASLNS